MRLCPLSPVFLEQKAEFVSLIKQLRAQDSEEVATDYYEKMKRFLDDGPAIIFVAVHSGKVIGYIWGYFRQNEGENRVHVTQFVVDGEHRGKGVGECLLQMMDGYAKEKNCNAVELNVLPYNTAAIRLYLKDGFEPQRLFMRRAYDICRDFSRNDMVTAEEYVEMTSLRVNDADIFVIGDEILWDGWLWEDRSKDTPMLPMTEIYPMALPEPEKEKIRSAVERIIRGSGVLLGEYNVETYFATSGEVFVIEINPRQAGNYIPQLIKQHTGVDLTKLLVSTAVGDMRYYEELKTYERQCNYVTLQVVFGKEDGVFEKLYIAPEVRPYVKWIDQKAKPGEKVVRGINAAEAVAFVDMQFDDYETQHKYTDEIEKYIYPIIKK